MHQDLDRLLGIVLPAVVAIELLAVFPGVPQWLVWISRALVVVATARILLHGTSYLTDMAGPGTREWSPAQTWLVLGGLATLLATVWTLLGMLAHRVDGLSPAVSLIVTTAAAAVTVMLSGYATGGQVGLPLASALAGASTAAVVLRRSRRAAGLLGVPVVGLFSLLVIGHYFGELSPAHALLLLCAPLLGWLPEFPFSRRLPPWTRGLFRVIVVGILVFAVVLHAHTKFVDNSNPGSPTEGAEPTFEYDMNPGG
jgi:hypothetical protein